MTVTEWMGVVSTIGLVVVGFLKFLQARKVDKVSAQSGAASNHRAGTQQIIDGFNLLLERAQETIEDDRDVIKLLEGRAERFEAQLDICMAENARLRKMYEPPH